MSCRLSLSTVVPAGLAVDHHELVDRVLIVTVSGHERHRQRARPAIVSRIGFTAATTGVSLICPLADMRSSFGWRRGASDVTSEVVGD